MTVKELMKKLAQFDENAEVKVMVDIWAENVNYVEDEEDGSIIIDHIEI